MKSLMTKKIVTMFITAVILLNPLQLRAQDAKSSGTLDDSLQDLTVVVASGAVGAVLGLSTLSFMDTPKDHLKNIAIGGALGVIFGVGYVVFGQATKSQSIVGKASPLPMTPATVESLARADFAKQKIAENYLLPTSVGYNFSF
jgi:hypothetical protein